MSVVIRYMKLGMRLGSILARSDSIVYGAPDYLISIILVSIGIRYTKLGMRLGSNLASSISIVCRARDYKSFAF